MPIVMTSGLGQRVFEEIARNRAHAAAQPGGGDVLLRNGSDRWQIKAGAFEVRMSLNFAGTNTNGFFRLRLVTP